MNKTVPAPEPIVVECDLPHPPALVWRALTEQELLASWLLPNDIRPEVGARFSFERPDRQSATPIECEVLDVEPNRTLRWRQTENGDSDGAESGVSSVVTIELTPTGTGGTHLRLVHDEFEVAAKATDTHANATVSSATVVRLRTARARRARVSPAVVCQLRRAA